MEVLAVRTERTSVKARIGRLATIQNNESGSKFQAADGLTVRPGCVIPLRELEFRFSRSGGPGGQNVNKVASRVELLFDPARSEAFSPAERERILQALAGRTEGGGILRVTSDESRSQWENRQRAMAKLAELVAAALRPRKKRRPTRVPRAARLRRKESKKRQGSKKRLRGSPGREADL
jgi:ribosome-associated protein